MDDSPEVLNRASRAIKLGIVIPRERRALASIGLSSNASSFERRVDASRRIQVVMTDIRQGYPNV
jgi:hypothetical protein